MKLVEAPPFDAASFDLVSSRAVLLTLPHPGYAVARWVKLLRPGGVLVLIGENSPADPERLKRQHRPPANWEPSDRYRAALQQVPLRSHTDQVARVVMEAAELDEIRSISMQAVIDARGEHEAPRSALRRSAGDALHPRRPAALVSGGEFFFTEGCITPDD